MALITREEVEALFTELHPLTANTNPANTRSFISWVLAKIAPEKLMSEYELARVYETASKDQRRLADYPYSEKHGAIMLQAPELWELMQQKDAIAEKIERYGETMLNPPTAGEL